MVFELELILLQISESFGRQSSLNVVRLLKGREVVCLFCKLYAVPIAESAAV